MCDVRVQRLPVPPNDPNLEREKITFFFQAVELQKAGDKKRNIVICILIVLLILAAGGITTGVLVSKKASEAIKK